MAPTVKRLSGSWLPVVLLLLVTAAAYVRIGELDFVSVDDPAYVTQNSNVLEGITREGLGWAFTAFHSANWHPITWISHMVDVQIFGMRPLGHHLTSLLFHIANVLLLFVAMQRLTGERWKSAFVAALFAVHPLHVESVAWVAERKDVLSTFFLFLTLLAYIRYAKKPSFVGYAYVFVALGLGLMAKPMLVTAPLILLMLDYWPLRRGLSWTIIREKAPLAGLALASCVVTYIAQRQGGAVQGLDLYPLGVRTANAAVACIAYLGKMIWPARPAVLYPHPGTSLPLWQVAMSTTLLAGITWTVVRYAKRVPYLAVGWLWYVVTLIPVIGLVQVGKQAMADRYTYIPLIGIFVAITWGLHELGGRLRSGIRRPAAVGLGAAVILALTGVTIAQTAYWRSGVTVFTRALQVTPDSYIINYCLADAYLEDKKPAEAVPFLREAVRLKPDFASGHDVLGYALAQQGLLDEGIEEIRRALEINPKLATAWNNMGGVLSQQKNYEKAITYFKRAIEITPNYVQAHINLGGAFEQMGRLDEAETHYRAAVEAGPKSATALGALGALLFRTGSYEEAEVHLRAATRLQPKMIEAQLYLGAALVQQRKSEESLAPLGKVVRANPRLAAGRYYMSLALYQQRAYDAARDELDAAVRYGWKPDLNYVEALERTKRP